MVLPARSPHFIFRRHGGSDNLDTNGITLCRPCHLRLVHAGHASVQRQGRAIVWRLPGRVVVEL